MPPQAPTTKSNGGPQLFLPRLLAMAFRSLVDDLHTRLNARGYRDVRPAFGFVLLEAAYERSTVGDMATLMGNTKQAASKLVATVQERGYITLSPSEDDARAKIVKLTQRGRRLLQVVEEIYVELEAEWAEIVSRQGLDSMKRDLEAAVRARHSGALPPARPNW
jgi:DNA-binding MarR family transcriptional regulator